MIGRAIVSIGILAVGACAGVDGKAPADFAELDDWGALRAVSADGVMYRLRREKNDPEADVGFWREALKKRMLDAGYVFVSESDFKMRDAAGALFEWAAPVGLEDYSYLIGFSVQGSKILLAEATGEVTRLTKHRDAILEAMGTVH